jgi:ATP adenylyltransferase
MSDNFKELVDILSSKKRLRMAHIYKPAMLLTLLRSGGSADKEDIAKDFMLRDESQIKFYKQRIVHPMPGNRLVRDELVTYEDGTYTLSDIFSNLTANQKNEIEAILEQRIADYFEMRNPFGDSNLDAVPGNLRYEVLKRARNRCELCGVSSKTTQIDADHCTSSNPLGQS